MNKVVRIFLPAIALLMIAGLIFYSDQSDNIKAQENIVSYYGEDQEQIQAVPPESSEADELEQKRSLMAGEEQGEPLEGKQNFSEEKHEQHEQHEQHEEKANQQGNQQNAAKKRSEAAPTNEKVIGDLVEGYSQSQQPAARNIESPADQELNKETNNLNVLFVGVGDGQLKMVSLYSIDYEETWRSAAIFFPTRTVVDSHGQLNLLYQIYDRDGVDGLVEAMENMLAVEINYYIKVDREILKKVAEIIDPIYVEGEQVDINNLFDMDVTPHDDYILGEMVKQFRKPSVFFLSLPELFISFRRYISTDFAITPSNLYLHYKVAIGIDPSLLTKTIVEGSDHFYQGEWVRFIPDDTKKNIVYRLTKE